MASKRLKVAAVVGGVLGIGGAVGFGPLVRYEARRVAETYGATIDIDQIRPTWSGIVIRGVDVRIAEVPSATIRLDEIAVNLGLSGRSLAFRGGTVTAVGPRELVLREAEGWRAHHKGGGGSGESRGGKSTEVEGLQLVWKNRADAADESIVASGVRFSRTAGKTSISAEQASVSAGRATLSVRNGTIVLIRSNGNYRVDGLSASSVDAEVHLPEPEATTPAGASERQADAVPRATRPAGGRARPEAGNHAKDGAGASSRAGNGNAGGGDPDSRPAGGRGVALRNALLRAAQVIDATLAEGADVDLAGVKARLRRGTERLNLGPGNLAVRREPGALIVELSPGEPTAPEANTAKPGGAAGARPAEQQALTFRLRVPLGAQAAAAEHAEAAQEIVADVQGGPIWLSTLGVHEGDLGLFDVARASLLSRAHVALSGDGEVLRLDGEGKVKNLSIRSAALSDEPVAGLDLAWRGKAEVRLDGSRVAVQDGEVDLGAIRVIARGEYQRVGDAHRVRGDFEVPLTACQSMLDSTPKGLAAKLQGMRLAGSLGIKGKVRFDTARLDRDFHLDWGTSNTCRVTEVPPELHVDRFKKPFRRPAYGPDGRRIEVESGPGTPGWAPYASIARFMEVAVMTTEDSGFLRHRGFDEEAIKNSIRENLRKRRFVRGASTISMQLAKNLYLERTKSVARKLQEAALTMYLEQELTKEQIMELYLNVVEFGPMVFGVGAAARHYFNTTASQLSLGQALYISSILPNPKVQHFTPGGAVSPGWNNYLRKLMEIANKRQRITDEELEEGLRETVVRGSPTPHRDPAAERPEDAPETPDDEPTGEWIDP